MSIKSLLIKTHVQTIKKNPTTKRNFGRRYMQLLKNGPFDGKCTITEDTISRLKICSLKMRTVPLLGTLLLWMASALFPMSKMAIFPLCWRLRSWTFRLAYWKEDLFRRENMTTQTSGSGGASAPSHSTRVLFWEGGKVSFQFTLQMINSLSCLIIILILSTKIKTKCTN